MDNRIVGHGGYNLASIMKVYRMEHVRKTKEEIDRSFQEILHKEQYKSRAIERKGGKQNGKIR